jgi:uncharacterized repeat protein (TIGR02543 family)
MDKETMSSYGLILITVLLMAALILLATPIGHAVMGDLDTKTNTLIKNTGVLGVNYDNDELFTVKVEHKYSGSSNNVVKTEVFQLKLNSKLYIECPHIDGYTASYKGGDVPDSILIDSYIATHGIIQIIYVPNDYNITYYLNGGKWVGSPNIPRSYQYGTTVVLPTNLEKEGYKFTGWYEDVGLGGNRVYSIKATDFEHKTFYAKFTMI